MKIAVDFHVVAGKYQGSKRYLEELYERLISKYASKGLEIVFCVDKNQQLNEKWSKLGQVLHFPTRSSIGRLLIGALTLNRKNNFNYFHFQYNTPLFGVNNCILTVHDILFESHPQFFSFYYRIRLKLLTRLAVRKAKVLFVVSEYTKRQLINIYNIPTERIVVTPNGVNPNVFNMNNIEESKIKVKNEFDLTDYIFSVGRIEPRKNQLSILLAAEKLFDKGVKVPPVVFAGHKDSQYQELFENAERIRKKLPVLFLQGVGDETLADLYKACSCFAYPSLAEGFGMPIVEAMACGCRVVTSNNTAMEEFNFGAITIDANDINALADFIETSLRPSDDYERRKICSQATLDRYSWDVVTDRYMEAVVGQYK